MNEVNSEEPKPLFSDEYLEADVQNGRGILQMMVGGQLFIGGVALNAYDPLPGIIDRLAGGALVGVGLYVAIGGVEKYIQGMKGMLAHRPNRKQH